MTGDYLVYHSVWPGRSAARPVIITTTAKPVTATAVEVSTFIFPTSTVKSSVKPMSSGNQDDGTMANQRGANYFFGFVFMFTVILLVIVGCGIGTRRRYFSSRRASEQRTLDPWTSGVKGDVTPPKLYDLEGNFVNSRGTAWNDIMPLSATYLSKKLEELNEKSGKNEQSSRRASRTPPHELLTPSQILFSNRRIRKPSPEPEPETPEAIRMVVLIVMPTPHDDQCHSDGHQSISGGSSGSNISTMKDLPEIQIGVETVAWKES